MDQKSIREQKCATEMTGKREKERRSELEREREMNMINGKRDIARKKDMIGGKRKEERDR